MRTFNRNFKGRSGIENAKVYLVSPETAVAAAITGKIMDPRKLGIYPAVNMPEKLVLNDNMFIYPTHKSAMVVVMGPNIKPLPSFKPLSDTLEGKVLFKLGDNISTVDILPRGTDIMALRSNIPEISRFTFYRLDKTFPSRALEKNGGFIVGGENYGQGSSREHAALAPKYLGIKAVIAKSFARIHLANLVNFGVLPLTFADKQDYECIQLDDYLELETQNLSREMIVKNISGTREFSVKLNLSENEKCTLKAGGKLAAIKAKQATE